jgi:hypothetical protein
MSSIYFVIVTCIAVVFGLLGSRLAAHKRRNAMLWFWVCFFFPPIILAILMVTPKKIDKYQLTQCPYCRGFITWDTISCKYCGKSLRQAPEEGQLPEENDTPFRI